MLDLVPLTRPWRKVAHHDGEARLIRKSLQFHLPQAQTIAITPAPVRRDQERLGVRIQSSSFGAPPPTNGCDREGPGVMVSANVHEARVAT